MKKIITTLVVLSVSIFSMMAQNSRHEKGNFSIDAGLGLNTPTHGYTIAFPAFKIDADYTFLTFGSCSLSGGAYFSMDARKLKSSDVKVVSWIVGPMVNFRYSLTDNIDLFGKAIAGYVGANSSGYTYGSFGAAAYAGGTWYFSSKLGVGAEIGYGGPTLVGVHMTFKF